MTDLIEQGKIFGSLAKPFPKEAYKDVSFGARKFTCIDAYHIVERLTEVFGLCGVGWGVTTTDYKIHQKSCACVGYLWYKLPGVEELGKVVAIGDGVIIHDNLAEAMKKAETNLISKASSFIGVGLDVFKGVHDSDPYVDRAISKTNAPSENKSYQQSPKGLINEAQRKRMFAIGLKSGYVTKTSTGGYEYDGYAALLIGKGFNRSDDVTVKEYDGICDHMLDNPLGVTAPPPAPPPPPPAPEVAPPAPAPDNNEETKDKIPF